MLSLSLSLSLPSLLLLLHPPPLLATTTTTTTTTPTPHTPSPPPPLHTLTLHHSSLHSPSPPLPIAVLTYTPHDPSLSTLVSFTPPANVSDPSALTQVIVYHNPSQNLGQSSGTHNPQEGVGGRSSSTTVTSTYSFHAPYTGRFRIALDREGGVVGASWHSRLLKEGGKGKRAQSDKARGRGDFDILAPKAAPAVVFEKGAKGKGGTTGGGIGGIGAGKGAEGEGEEVVEKTMLQKYWWVLLGVAVLAMAGGGDK